MPTTFSFRTMMYKKKHDVNRGKDRMNKICELVMELAMKIIDFKKKAMKLLTKEHQ